MTRIPRTRAESFTLTELLIVMVIIAILLGLLMPVFAMAFREARKTQWRVHHRREPGPLWDANIMILCGANGCVHEEFIAVNDALIEADALRALVSTTTGPIPGTYVHRTKRPPRMLLSEAMSDKYEWHGIIIVVGPGATQFVTDPALHDFLRKCADNGCVFAATSNAPLVLAQAGMIKHRRVTGDPAIAGFLTAAGADYTGAPFETDHIFATARDTTGVSKMMEHFTKRAER